MNGSQPPAAGCSDGERHPAFPAEHLTFVLVHGGRHGGWCWRPVSERLRSAGHEVHTPTLTGLGDRAHLLTPQIGLSTHVQDVVATFEFENLHDVVLVGHSYGGMVVTGAMERIGDRVRALVLLDGHLPHDGESVFDIIGPQRADRMLALAQRGGEDWYVPPEGASRYGISEPSAISWAEQRMTAQPLKTYQDRIDATSRAWNHPGMFIECTPSSLEPHVLERARHRSASNPRILHRVLPTPHNAMITAPSAVVDLLYEAGASS